MDDESRDEDDHASLTVPDQQGADQTDESALAPSLASSAPENQLLRYKLLLAQEEAKKSDHSSAWLTAPNSSCMRLAAADAHNASLDSMNCLCASTVCIWRIVCRDCCTS